MFENLNKQPRGKPRGIWNKVNSYVSLSVVEDHFNALIKAIHYATIYSLQKKFVIAKRNDSLSRTFMEAIYHTSDYCYKDCFVG